MSPLRLSLGVIAFFGLVPVVACSSSSSKATTSDSGAPSDDGNTTISPSDDSSASNPLGMIGNLLAGVTCGPLSGLTGLLGGAGGGGGGGDGGSSSKCAAGQACCTMIMIPSLSASCMPVGSSCSGTLTECSAGADCASGQVCCSGSADGGTMMAPASDAAAAGGLAGLAGGFGNIFPSTFCQASCTALQTQQCASDTECPMGQTCNAAAAGMGGFGGFGGLAGGGAMAPKTCGTPPPEAGTTAPMMDSGTTTTTTPEASVDAPSE